MIDDLELMIIIRIVINIYLLFMI